MLQQTPFSGMAMVGGASDAEVNDDVQVRSQLRSQLRSQPPGWRFVGGRIGDPLAAQLAATLFAKVGLAELQFHSFRGAGGSPRLSRLFHHKDRT